MPDNIFNLEDLTRDLALQYAQGYLTTDEYLTVWEDLTRAYVCNNNGGVAV